MRTKGRQKHEEIVSTHLVGVLDSIVFGNTKLRSLEASEPERKLAKRLKTENQADKDEPKPTSSPINKNSDYSSSLNNSRDVVEGQESKGHSSIHRSLNKNHIPSWLDEARRRKAELASASGDDSSDILAEYVRTVAPSRTGLIRLQKFDCATRHRSICSAMGFLGSSNNSADKSQVLWSADFTGLVNFSPILRNRCAQPTPIELKTHILSACSSYDKTRLICVGGSTKLSYVDVETQQVSTLHPLRTEEGVTLKQVVTLDRSVCVLDDYGRIHHIDDRTKRACRSFNSASINTCMVFDPSCAVRLISGDNNGELFEWDLSIGRCTRRHKVDGVLNISALATSGVNRLLVGSQSGYVSVLCTTDLHDKLKDFGNLTTQIDLLCGHVSAPLAIMSSPAIDGAFRLLHTGEKPFVYQNWPSDEGNKFKGVTTAAFSENDGFLSIGDKTGVVRLWNIPDLASCIVPATFK